MIVYDCFDVLLAAGTHFNFISAYYIVKGVFFWGEWYLLGVRKIALFSL